MSQIALSVSGLCKRFGGLSAVNNVSLQLQKGALHAVIGTNGAGKSTLINLLSGDILPSSGTIHLHGREITSLSPQQRSQLGIGRSYQKTNIFGGFSTLENCRLAAQSREPHAFNPFRPASHYRSIIEAAEQALEAVGLQHRAGVAAGTLSHGEQRQLEIAMSLATRPQVLLLDEPLAGMGAEEAARMVRLLQQVSQTHAVLLVEHDMEAVFALAQTLTVMVNGNILETGTPEQIRNSAQVQRAYLGSEDDGAQLEKQHG
jgi:branched-chain amino acid transport system ATP-binding protein